MGKEFDLIFPKINKILLSEGAGYVESGKAIASFDLNDCFGFTPVEAQVLEVGKTYTIQLDSGTFTGICKLTEDGGNVPYVGNINLQGGNGYTGEPYLIACANDNPDDQEPQWLVMAIDVNGGTHVTISEAETVFTINPRFLPEGGFGYTEGNAIHTIEPKYMPNNGAGVGYTEDGEIIIRANGMYSGEYISMAIAYEHIGLVEGTTYEVVTDSGTYTAVCKLNGSTLYLGDMKVMGAAEWKGEFDYPFVVYEGMQTNNDVQTPVTYFCDVDKGSSMTVRMPKVVHTIEPKFLPGAVLPVVNVTSASYPNVGEDGLVPIVKLSAEESAQFEAAAKTGLPAIVNFNVVPAPDQPSLIIMHSDVCNLSKSPYIAGEGAEEHIAGYISAYVAMDLFANVAVIFSTPVDDSGLWEMGG